MLSWFPAEHAQSSPRLYTNNTKSRRILCDIPSIQIKSADIFSSFCEKFWSSLHQKKTNMIFFFSFAKHICLMMHLEFYFKSWARVLFFSHVFCGDLSLKSCFDLWRPFLLSLLRYLLVFCAFQKCKCVCISVNVYFVEVHEIFIL